MRRTVIPALLLLLFSCASVSAADHPMLPLGAPLPDFRLPGIDGREYSPADFASASVLATSQSAALEGQQPVVSSSAKPMSLRCSGQPSGRWPLTIAPVMSGASQASLRVA